MRRTMMPRANTRKIFLSLYIVVMRLAVGVNQGSTSSGPICDDIDFIPDGDVIPMTQPPFKVGSVLMFKCDSGYKEHGLHFITCMSNGRWSGPVPYCQTITCQRNTTKIKDGRKCWKSCARESDCKLQNMKCRCDDWCGMSCFNPDADCVALLDPENGYIIGNETSYGRTVTYGCNEGFVLVGESTRRCQSDQDWSGSVPKCFDCKDNADDDWCTPLVMLCDAAIMKKKCANTCGVCNDQSNSCSVIVFFVILFSLVGSERWSRWSWSGECHVTCGGGFRVRTRKCITTNCKGEATEKISCNDDPCPPVLGPFEKWKECSTTCGNGIQERTRRCLKGDCNPGELTENRTCKLRECEDQGEMTSQSTSGSSKTTESPHQATTSTNTRTESTTTSIGVPCTNGIMYENKCFIPVDNDDDDYDNGVAICESLGGHLANIYSQIHMDDVMKYIIRENRHSDVEFRLGMKYDPKADKLTLRDGTDAPAGLKWYPGYPRTVEANGQYFADYTNVILEVSSDPSSTYQYILNNPPSYARYVLCETE